MPAYQAGLALGVVPALRPAGARVVPAFRPAGVASAFRPTSVFSAADVSGFNATSGISSRGMTIGDDDDRGRRDRRQQPARDQRRGRSSSFATTRDRKPALGAPSVSRRAASSIRSSHVGISTLAHPQLDHSSRLGNPPLDRADRGAEHRRDLVVSVFPALRQQQCVAQLRRQCADFGGDVALELRVDGRLLWRRPIADKIPKLRRREAERAGDPIAVAA